MTIVSANKYSSPIIPLTAIERKPEGEIQRLWDDNWYDIYRRYSPYTDNSGLLTFGPKQPYVWIYIDEAKRFPQSIRRYESRLFPLGSSLLDAQRVAKFMVSGRGVLFLVKNFLLQTGNAFNETRIYNPVSPIIAAGLTPISFGTVRPKRHLEITGISGIVQSLVGNQLSGFFGLTKVNPPPGTTAAQNGVETVLPTNYPGNTNYSKGLLRAGTAKLAKSRLDQKWPSGTGNIAKTGFFKNVADYLFRNFLPQRQDAGITYRSDEKTYGTMLSSTDRLTHYIKGAPIKMSQLWLAGTLKTRDGLKPLEQSRMYNDENREPLLRIAKSSVIGPNIYSRKSGYTVLSPDGSSRYGKSVGVHSDGYAEDPASFENSDVMVQYGFYVQDDRQYPTKKIDKNSVELMDENLKKVVNQIKESGIYEVLTNTNSYNLSSGEAFSKGYNRIKNVKTPDDRGKRTPRGMFEDYNGRSIRMVSNDLTQNPSKFSYKLPGQGRPDAINTLNVLGKDKKIDDPIVADWTEWNPYQDDIIAFFFYDVVNQRYIPFRATIKSLTEANNASWEELVFIGRADRLYSYSGFSRTLSFSFNVMIGSIVELIPTWQRLNYLSSLVKPSRYTVASQEALMATQDSQFAQYNNFLVPPMVMLTIGDLIKDQPIVVTSVSLNIPDDAVWETLNSNNSSKWGYLANIIQSQKVGKNYGQLPREAVVSITSNVLEKERPRVGATHYGHAPRSDDYTENVFKRVDPNNEEPTEMHKALTVYNK